MRLAKRSAFVPLIMAALIAAGSVVGQVTNLHVFSGYNATGVGADPMASLLTSGTTMYGTASSGGLENQGSVFSINTDGSGFGLIHSFIGQDGSFPVASLTMSGRTLYGTTEYGGTSGNGTLFAVNIDGSGFSNLYNFSNGSDGANPMAGLVFSNNMLYGTANNGGSGGSGTVFSFDLGTMKFSTLYPFTALDTNFLTNGDGAHPQGNLVLSGSTLYGTANAGGLNGAGTLFQVGTGGAGFNSFYTFNGGSDGYGADHVRLHILRHYAIWR